MLLYPFNPSSSRSKHQHLKKGKLNVTRLDPLNSFHGHHSGHRMTVILTRLVASLMVRLNGSVYKKKERVKSFPLTFILLVIIVATDERSGWLRARNDNYKGGR